MGPYSRCLAEPSTMTFRRRSACSAVSHLGLGRALNVWTPLKLMPALSDDVFHGWLVPRSVTDEALTSRVDVSRAGAALRPLEDQTQNTRKQVGGRMRRDQHQKSAQRSKSTIKQVDA